MGPSPTHGDDLGAGRIEAPGISLTCYPVGRHLLVRHDAVDGHMTVGTVS